MPHIKLSVSFAPMSPRSDSCCDYVLRLFIREGQFISFKIYEPIHIKYLRKTTFQYVLPKLLK